MLHYSLPFDFLNQGATSSAMQLQWQDIYLLPTWVLRVFGPCGDKIHDVEAAACCCSFPSSKEASSEVLRENCGCTVSWWIQISCFGFFCQCCWSRCCGITVNDPALKTLAVSLLQCCSDSNLNIDDSDYSTKDSKVFWTFWSTFDILAILFCWCNPQPWNNQQSSLLD